VTEKCFIYGNEDISDPLAARATVPAGVANKEALFATLATQLDFPDYFGRSWDALEECLHDLSWLPPGTVVVTHAEVPLIGDVKNATIYVSILHGVVRRETGPANRPLVVVFPVSSRAQIEWLLRLRRAQDVQR
jgi:hypothetical protein